MKRSRLTEHQIISILKEADAGIKVKDVCRRHGISDATCYNWKSKYGGISAFNLKRVKEMEQELSQYKRMYAELAHENFAHQGRHRLKALRPPRKRELADFLVAEHNLSVSRATPAA